MVSVVRLGHLVGTLVLAVLGFGNPVTAHAASAARAAAASAVQVSAEGTRTRIHIHLDSGSDRVVWSKDPVTASALKDIDNDGDLDLVVSTPRQALVVWRNTDRGFVKIHAGRGPRRVHHDFSLNTDRTVPATSQVTDDHRDPASLMPAPGRVAAADTTPTARFLVRTPWSPALPLHLGRAPPALR